MRIELVLGAGSAHGLAHIGVIRALQERHLEVVALHGCSMGALVAGAWAAGTFRELELAVDGASLTDLLRLVDPTPRGAGILAGRRVGHLLEDLYGDTRIEDLPLPLRVVATDVNTWEMVEFTSGPLLDAVRASIGVPGIFSPVRVRERMLADGTLVSPLPVPDRYHPDADRVLAVSVLGPPPTAEWTRSVTRRLAPRYVMSALSLAQHSIEVVTLKAHPEVAVLQLDTGTGSSLSFHLARDIAARGQLVAREALPGFGM